jgi:glycosyltransferase involved in cell wall biosynthesis
MHYSKIFLTNVPSFYKLNLYNRINSQERIFVIFTLDTAEVRKKDFFLGEINFDHVLYDNYSLLKKIYTTWRIVKKNTYDQLVISGVIELTSWLCAFISPKSKNATVVESSYHEANVNGIKGWLKRLFFTRISVTYASGKAQEKLARLHDFKNEVIITKGVGLFNIVNRPFLKSVESVKEFLYVGRLSPEKNLVFLINVFSQLPQYRLHTVGYGPQEEELKKIMTHNIIFHGAVENRKLPEIYQSCHVFVLPSIKEPWGLVVEEAFNNGLPVIVSNKVGCAEEIVEENRNGLIFEYNCESSLKQMVRKMTNIEFYYSLKLNISKMDFEKVADYQVNCYLK